MDRGIGGLTRKPENAREGEGVSALAPQLKHWQFSPAPSSTKRNGSRARSGILSINRSVEQSRFRLGQIAREFDVRLEECTRIARELHDLLLQTLLKE